MTKSAGGFLDGLARFLGGAALVVGAGMGGNWVGAQLRTRLTGRPAQAIRFETVTAGGQRISSIPVVTKFYPALAAGLLGRPAWLWVFLGGLMTGLLVDDRVEAGLWEVLGERLLKMREDPQEVAAEA